MTSLIEGLITAELHLLGVDAPADAPAIEGDEAAPEAGFGVAEYRSAAG
ncbi:hypothetical protein [Bordetella genomosp. 1]|nr:hypothetical protein [Bordetella genomosp. 1]